MDFSAATADNKVKIMREKKRVYYKYNEAQ